MSRIFVLMLFCLTALKSAAQFYLTNGYYLENDSSLWKSPISPRMVTLERIKEVRVSEKKWNCTHIGSPCVIRRDSRAYNCGYFHKTTTYAYDTLGFPIKIIVDWENDSIKPIEYTCINSYNTEGRLIKSELFFHSDTLLKPEAQNTMEYTEKKQLKLSQIYLPYPRLIRKNEYKYNAQEKLEQLDDYEPYFIQNKDSLRLYQSFKFLYDTNNRLCEMSDRFTHYFYDQEGIYNGFSHYNGKHWWQKTRRVHLGKGVTGNIITFRNPGPYSHRFKKGHKLDWVREIKNDKIYTWKFNYVTEMIFKGTIASCQISDLKSGLPLCALESYGWPGGAPYYAMENYGWSAKQVMYSYKLIRFKRVMFPPGRSFHFKFPQQPDITEYFYVKR